MIAQNLFIDKPEMEDISMHKLPDDSDAWSEDIIQKIKERVPDCAGMATIVRFVKKDDESGTATGSVEISNEKKKVIVPLIVKDFRLFPIDVFQAEGKLLPLTPDYFKAAFSDNDTFAKLEEYPTFGGIGRFEDSNLWNATYPPSLGRYAYASAGYPMLDFISETIDGSSIKEALLKDKLAAVNFHKNGHSELIKKLANHRPVNMNEFGQGEKNLTDKSIIMLRRDGENKYTILANTDNVYNPIVHQTDRAGAAQVIGGPTMERETEISDEVHSTLNEVDQNGEKLLSVPNHNEVELAQPQSEVPEFAKEFDSYSVRTKNGLNVSGFVLPVVIDLKMKKVDLKIFIGKTMATIQPEIAGVRIDMDQDLLKGEMPTPGVTGCFVFQSAPNKALATIPLTMVSVTDDCGRLRMRAKDLMGAGYDIERSNSKGMFQAIADSKKGNYVLPAEFKWIPMQGFGRISNSPADYAAMGMGQTKVGSSVTVIDNQGSYAIRGVKKYAQASGWDDTFLQPYQAKFILASLGCGQEKIAHVLKQARRQGSALVNDINFVPVVSEKISAARPTARKLVKQAEHIRTDLIKAASFIENSQTVDAMLALNFVNPDNIAKFVNKIPAFKACISNLASCLLASRIGMKEIPSQAVSSAMYRLIDVVQGLEALRTTQGEN